MSELLNIKKIIIESKKEILNSYLNNTEKNINLLAIGNAFDLIAFKVDAIINNNFTSFLKEYNESEEAKLLIDENRSNLKNARTELLKINTMGEDELLKIMNIIACIDRTLLNNKKIYTSLEC
jgi:hypothetical protein